MQPQRQKLTQATLVSHADNPTHDEIAALAYQLWLGRSARIRPARTGCEPKTSLRNQMYFWFSPARDAAAAKRFLQRALKVPGRRRPRVINVDGNPSYPR